MRLRSLMAAIAWGAALLAAGWVHAADFAGKYQGDKLNADITTSTDGYIGTIHLGDKQYPIKAKLAGDNLTGTFNASGNDFPFTAILAGNTMSFTTGGATYTMQKQGAPVNPLDAVAANPLAQPQAAPTALPTGAAQGSGPANADYTVLASNDSGKSLFVQRPDIKTIADALQFGTFYLSKQFDGRPAVTKAYSDSQDSRRGIASFTGKWKSADVKGMILAGVGDNGAAITITFSKNDAPAADVTALLNALPTDAKWSDYQLPNNLGTIRVADGWRVTPIGNIGHIRINGPEKQLIDLNDAAEVVTPNSMMAQIMANNQAQAKQFGQKLPPSGVFIAPYTGPVEAIKNLVPQISQISQDSGGPSITLDKIIDNAAVQSSLPNGQAARISYDSTTTGPDGPMHSRALGQYETYPVAQDTWGVCFSELSAPSDKFARDLPLMLQMANSLKLNEDAVRQNSQNDIAAQNQRFNAFEASMKEKNDAFDGYMKSVQNNELVRERSNTDFDEVIRGYRTVEDTQTGERSSADLGNVTDIVNKLNEADPGRYKEIPLRDEMYPLPGNAGE